MSSRRHFLRRTAQGLVLVGGIDVLGIRAGGVSATLGSARGAIDKPRPVTDLKPLQRRDSIGIITSSNDLSSGVTRDADLRHHPDVLAYVEFKDIDTIHADLARSNWADGAHRPWYAISQLAYDVGTHEAGSNFCVPDPAFYSDRGLSFMRFSGEQRLIAAQLFAGKGIRHAFCRYVLVIDPDVVTYMTELGVKLPGFAGEYEDTVLHPPHAGTVTFSWRMEHGPKNDIDLRDYLYDGTIGSTFGDVHQYGVPLPVGMPFTIEQELDVDTMKGRVWLNGALVGERDVVTDVDIEMLFINIYHGGTRLATAPIHYWLGGCCIAKRYIGVPLEMRTGHSLLPIAYAAPPATDTHLAKWRQGLPAGQWTEVPGTSLSRLPVPSANIDAWCGLAAVDIPTEHVALWISAAGGGHTDSNDNGVYGIDLMSDAPMWHVMCPPSAKAARVTASESGAGMPAVPYAHDGKPNSCHTYWSLVWCPQRGRVFRPFSSALWYAAQGARNMDGFDPKAGVWDAKGTWPDSLGNSMQALVACDPNTGDIYYGSPSGGMYKWTQETNTWANIKLAGTFGFPGYHGGMVDAKRNRLVRSGLTLNGDYNQKIPHFDLTTLIATIDVVTGVTADPPLGARTITHDTGNDKYYLTDSVNVYQIDPTTWAGIAMPPLPVRPRNGALGRFAYFPSLKGIAYYPSFAANVWFMATE